MTIEQKSPMGNDYPADTSAIARSLIARARWPLRVLSPWMGEWLQRSTDAEDQSRTAGVGPLLAPVRRAVGLGGTWLTGVDVIGPAVAERFAGTIVERFPDVGAKYQPRPLETGPAGSADLVLDRGFRGGTWPVEESLVEEVESIETSRLPTMAELRTARAGRQDRSSSELAPQPIRRTRSRPEFQEDAESHAPPSQPTMADLRAMWEAKRGHPAKPPIPDRATPQAQRVTDGSPAPRKTATGEDRPAVRRFSQIEEITSDEGLPLRARAPEQQAASARRGSPRPEPEGPSLQRQVVEEPPAPAASPPEESPRAGAAEVEPLTSEAPLSVSPTPPGRPVRPAQPATPPVQHQVAPAPEARAPAEVVEPVTVESPTAPVPPVQRQVVPTPAERAPVEAVGPTTVEPPTAPALPVRRQVVPVSEERAPAEAAEPVTVEPPTAPAPPEPPVQRQVVPAPEERAPAEVVEPVTVEPPTAPARPEPPVQRQVVPAPEDRAPAEAIGPVTVEPPTAPAPPMPPIRPAPPVQRQVVPAPEERAPAEVIESVTIEPPAAPAPPGPPTRPPVPPVQRRVAEEPPIPAPELPALPGTPEPRPARPATRPVQRRADADTGPPVPGPPVEGRQPTAFGEPTPGPDRDVLPQPASKAHRPLTEPREPPAVPRTPLLARIQARFEDDRAEEAASVGLPIPDHVHAHRPPGRTELLRESGARQPTAGWSQAVGAELPLPPVHRPPSTQAIQRQPLDLAPEPAMVPASADVAQRAVVAEPIMRAAPGERKEAGPDLDDLARQVYPILKRMLAVERERGYRR